MNETYRRALATARRLHRQAKDDLKNTGHGLFKQLTQTEDVNYADVVRAKLQNLARKQLIDELENLFIELRLDLPEAEAAAEQEGAPVSFGPEDWLPVALVEKLTGLPYATIMQAKGRNKGTWKKEGNRIYLLASTLHEFPKKIAVK